MKEPGKFPPQRQWEGRERHLVAPRGAAPGQDWEEDTQTQAGNCPSCHRPHFRAPPTPASWVQQYAHSHTHTYRYLMHMYTHTLIHIHKDT